MSLWNLTTTPVFSYPSWFTHPTWSPDKPVPTFLENFTMPPWPAIPDYFTMPMQLEPPTREPRNSLLLTISLAVRVVLFVTCLIENSIAIFVLHKGIRNGRKTFARYTLISVACSDILSALVYYPAEFVKFSQGEFVWLVQGEVGDVLCKFYSFLVQIPGKVLVLCLVALACDVTRNVSSKGRRERTQQFSAILMIFFWIIAAGLSSMYIAISEVQSKMCLIDSSKQFMINLIHSFLFVVPADLILTILNLVMFCRVRRRKKEVTGQKRKARRAGRMKVRRQRNRIGDAKNVTKVQQLTEEAQEILSSKTCEPGGEDYVVETSQQTSSNPSETPNGQPTDYESKIFNDGSDDSAAEVDGGEEDADQGSQEENLDMTREEAKIESVTSFLFVILSITLLILPYVCKGPACKTYVFFAVQIVVDIYGVIKPGIYAYTDKEFRKRYKQLSPFACCCFRRIQCRKVPQQVGTRNSLRTQEDGL